MTLISVIVTTYNAAEFIEATLNSILNQEGKGTAFEIELLVIDDCSTDNTKACVEACGIQVISTTSNTGGPNTGRNIGLKRATGDYISIADHDDHWNSDRILSLLPFLSKAPVVTSGYTVIDSSTDSTQVYLVADAAVDSVAYKANQTFITKLTRATNGQNTYLGAIFFAKNLKDILFEEHFGMVDYDWICRIFEGNTSIEVNKSLYTRYIDGQNLSLNPSYRRKDYYYSLYFIDQYFRKYPKEVRIAKKKINGSRARYHYLVGEMKEARYFFKQAGFRLIHIAYYMTTFFGSEWVKRKFRVFG